MRGALGRAAMSRSARWVGGAGGLALLATLLLMAPMASATTPPFTATPSYVPYGGTHYLGVHVVLASGSGYNKETVAPAFSAVTGHLHEGMESVATNSGTFWLQSWAGLRNLTVNCPANCAAGNRTITVTWNLTWTAILNSSCNGTASNPVVLSSANVSLVAQFIDWSTTPATLVGSSSLVLYHHNLLGAGQTGSGAKGKVYVQTFTANLASGSYNTIRAVVLEQTYADANAPAGSVCTSWAKAGTGLVATDTLAQVKVS